MTSLIINTDGGSRGNPGPAAVGIVIKDETGKLVHQIGEYLGSTTNNVAEYTAVLLALKWLLSYKSTLNSSPIAVNFFLDSLLVVSQLNGRYKIKNVPLQNLHSQIKALEKALNLPVKYHHIPREQNSQADEIVNNTLDKASDFH